MASTRNIPLARRQRRNKLRRNGLIVKHRTRQPLRIRLVDAQRDPIAGITVTVLDATERKPKPVTGQSDEKGNVQLATGKSSFRGGLIFKSDDGTERSLDNTSIALLNHRLKAITITPDEDVREKVEPFGMPALLRSGDILTLA